MKRNPKYKSRDMNAKHRGKGYWLPNRFFNVMRNMRRQRRAMEKRQMEMFLQRGDEDIIYSVPKEEADDIWHYD